MTLKALIPLPALVMTVAALMLPARYRSPLVASFLAQMKCRPPIRRAQAV